MLEYILIWVLFLLLPLIPAILIYKEFPKAYTKLTGRILGFKITAGGAVGLYLACILLSNYLITSRMLDSIESNNKIVQEGKYVNELTVMVNIKDQNSLLRNINLEEALRLNKLTVALVPDVRRSVDRFTLYIPKKLMEQDVYINLDYKGCETKTINIDEIKKAINDNITLQETLYVKKADFKQFESPGNPETTFPQEAP